MNIYSNVFKTYHYEAINLKYDINLRLFTNFTFKENQNIKENHKCITLNYTLKYFCTNAKYLLKMVYILFPLTHLKK